jgi:hypothetical protein
MSHDLFEQLARHEVPPVPENLSRGVHQRLNKTLVLVHTVEFALQVLPYCAVFFGRAVMGLLAYTVTGRFPNDRSPPSS